MRLELASGSTKSENLHPTISMADLNELPQPPCPEGSTNFTGDRGIAKRLTPSRKRKRAAAFGAKILR
ncbi:hypothetical protein MTO96_032914 [Rhipicephalus appendiculatus]